MSIPPFSNMSFVTSLSGSTGANMYKNATDKKWVIKRSKKGQGGFEQVKTEAVVDDIYQAMGIPVPVHFLDVPNKALILEYIDGKSLASATTTERAKAKEELQKGFIVDALLANWDVIGMFEDNILIPADGSPAVRIDNGGSLTFRAQGGKKAFNKVVTEIDTMRNKQISPQAAKIFGDLTDTDIDTQIKTIIVPNYELILSLTPEDLKPSMKGRMDNLIERTVWTNASAFKNTVEQTSQPEHIPAIQDALIKYFKAGWLKYFKNINVGSANNSDQRLLAFINKTLKDNGAVVSGGFILKAIGSFVDEKSVDIDIYVPTATAEEFRKVMTKLFDSSSVVTHIVSDSPGSFFKKNGIVSVSKYAKTSPKHAEMDIIEVNEDRTPVDVVKNFDLTFCENWYDGENVWMTYPEHVKSKAGFLENHYLNILFTGNPVLIGRMKKYIGRGFKIGINNPVTKKAENVTDGIESGKLFQQQVQNLGVAVPKNTHYGSYGIAYRTHGTNSSYYVPATLLNAINSSIIQSPKNNTKNMNISAEILNIPIITSFNGLTRVNIQAIKWYTGTGSDAANNFLYLDNYCVSGTHIIQKWVRKKFPQGDDETISQYKCRVMYYVFVNLYNGIQKAPKYIDNPVKLYRGAKTWYLPENTDKFHYLNSFSSTSIRPGIAVSFGTGGYNAATGSASKKVYVFYVHPKCNYMNVKSISRHKNEDEILLNPYNRYIYLNKNKSTDGMVTFKNYAIFPTDIDIPSTYETFMPWKKGVVNMTTVVVNGVDVTPPKPNTVVNGEVKPVKGGRIMVNTYGIVPGTDVYKSRANKTRTNKKLKLIKPNIRLRTIKMKSHNTNISKKQDVDENTIRRFTDPLPSFPGKPPTAAETGLIQKMRELIKNEAI